MPDLKNKSKAYQASDRAHSAKPKKIEDTVGGKVQS